LIYSFNGNSKKEFQKDIQNVLRLGYKGLFLQKRYIDLYLDDRHKLTDLQSFKNN
jgi:hypothetical protein